MGIWQRSDFSQGWVPDADAVNGPKTGLLRMDNCILDELGAVTLRAGSSKINSSPFADLDVHSLYTVTLSGTRYRMSGAGDAVYANGTSIASGFAGSGDIAFGSQFNQILFARSTTKKKYDGTSVRNWGISQTGTAPTVAALSADSKTFSTCTSTESPGLVDTAALGNEGTLTFVTGQDGTANGAAQIVPNSSTGRGTITKTFSAATDFTVYDGGQIGTDDDLIQFYLYLTEPQYLNYVTVMIDVNASSTNAFQDDYYSYTFDLTQPTDVSLDSSDLLNNTYDGDAFDRARVIAKAEASGFTPPTTRLRTDKPSGNVGWNIMQVRRGQFTRTGTTFGKDWSTVIAIRLVCGMAAGGSSAAVRYDDIKIIGGNLRPLTGTYAYRYVLAYNNGKYVALSAPSAISTAMPFKAQGGDITIPSDGSRDSQINEIWLFRIGGNLPGWYRVNVKTGVSGTGSVSVSDTLSDRDALIVDIPLEVDNAIPPSDMIDIEGPYYDRTFCLTATTLYPSRRLNPDSYATGQAITVADATETAYWVKKALGGLYIGTSKDIYRLDGTGAELPDGTIDFTKTPLNVDHPPVSDAVAQEGNLLVFLASDGWRGFSGSATQNLTTVTSLLYRGYTRHGVSPVNLLTGRFRAAITKGQLTTTTPEGASTTSTSVLYRHPFNTPNWYRHTYGVSWRCVFAEPDGTLIGSDTAGTVWVLDTGTLDGATGIDVTLWTGVDDNGAPFQRKLPVDSRILADTGGNTFTAAYHLNGASSASTSVSVSATGLSPSVTTLDGTAAFRQIQMRLTGTASAGTFLFRSDAVAYHDLPLPFRGRLLDTNVGAPQLKTLTGYVIRCCTVGATVTVTPYLDDVAQTPFTLTTGADQPETITVPIAAPVTATEIALAVGGDLELYSWQPLVTAKRPLGVKTYDSGPMDLGAQQMIWIREIRLKVDATDDITATVYFDGTAYDPLTLSPTPDVTPTTLSVRSPFGFKGTTARLVLTSNTAFYPYWVEFIRRSTGAAYQVPSIKVPLPMGGEVAG